LFDAIGLTLTQIAKIPKIGVSYPFQNSRLTGLRKLQVKDFGNYIIFYLEKVRANRSYSYFSWS
jgi:hypothetical protein